MIDSVLKNALDLVRVVVDVAVIARFLAAVFRRLDVVVATTAMLFAMDLRLFCDVVHVILMVLGIGPPPPAASIRATAKKELTSAS